MMKKTLFELGAAAALFILSTYSLGCSSPSRNPANEEKNSSPSAEKESHLSGEDVLKALKDPATPTTSVIHWIEELSILSIRFQKFENSIVYNDWMDTLPRADAPEVFYQLIKRNFLTEDEREKIDAVQTIISDLNDQLRSFELRLTKIAPQDEEMISKTKNKIAKATRELKKYKTLTHRAQVIKQIILDAIEGHLRYYTGPHAAPIFERLMSAKNKKRRLSALSHFLHFSKNKSEELQSKQLHVNGKEPFTLPSLQEIWLHLLRSKNEDIKVLLLKHIDAFPGEHEQEHELLNIALSDRSSTVSKLARNLITSHKHLPNPQEAQESSDHPVILKSKKIELSPTEDYIEPAESPKHESFVCLKQKLELSKSHSWADFALEDILKVCRIHESELLEQSVE